MTEADQSEASAGSCESDQRLNVITAGECPDFLCQITLVSLGIMYAAHAGCQLQASIKKAILFIHYPGPAPDTAMARCNNYWLPSIKYGNGPLGVFWRGE